MDDKIVTAITTEVENQIQFEQFYLEQLAAFVDVEVAGGDASTDFPEVYELIQSDKAFAMLYEGVLHLARLEQDDALPEVDDMPPLDFADFS